MWLHLLQTLPNGNVTSVNWTEVAEQFTLWLQQGVQRSQILAAALENLRRGHVVSLVAWWAYVTCAKVGPIRRPSLMSTVVLDKKRYVPVEEVRSPDEPHFVTLPLHGPPPLTARRCASGT